MWFIYLPCFLFGAYFLNSFFSFLDLSFINFFDIWIILAGGIFLLFIAVLAYKIKLSYGVPYLLLGLYFINNTFNFIKIPDYFYNWAVLLGGIFFFLGIFILSRFKKNALG
jgi:hypothetical protein